MSQEGQIVRNKRTGEMGIVRNGVVVPMNQQQGGGVFVPDQAAPFDAPKARADAANAGANAQVNQATAPAQIRSANAGATVAEIEAEAAVEEARRAATAEERKALRDAFKTDSILRSIRNARQIVQTDGGTGWGSLLAVLPTTTARKLESELTPIKGNLAFDRLQQMRDDSPTGGGVGSVSDSEMNLLASTVSNLDTGVDAETFLRRLDEIERHFIGMQVSALGLDPKSEEGRSAFKNDYGYTGVFDGEIADSNRSLADPNATETAVKIPEWYQQEHLRYLRDNWDKGIDATDYLRFRSNLDERAGLNPDLEAYGAAVGSFNDAAREGLSPEQLGVVPDPSRDMGGLEQAINWGAQSAPGTIFANATNSFAAGLPARLGGGQEQLEMLREARPYSSAIGEMGGAALGAFTLGGAAGQIGGRAGQMLANPYASEALHSTIYGATQDDNALRGAGWGLASSLGGSYAGQKIGGYLPEYLAPGAVRQADESVPSVDQLKSDATGLYNDMHANGITAGPAETSDMFQRANSILAGNGRIGGTGEAIIPDGHTRQAYDLLGSFDGGTMSPPQAQTVRETLAEGLMSPVPKERRIASQLLEDFDQWADPVMPGAAQAREVSSRYIRGQQLDQLTGKGAMRGERMKGNDVGDSTRTLFGQLDERVHDGRAAFDDATVEAIGRTARGDKFTNAMRVIGKYGLGNPISAGGIGVSGASALGGYIDPVWGATALGGATLASAARKLSQNRTLRHAEEAKLLALGGPEYEKALLDAAEVAQKRGGRLFGATAGAAGSMYSRPEWQYLPPEQR